MASSPSPTSPPAISEPQSYGSADLVLRMRFVGGNAADPVPAAGLVWDSMVAVFSDGRVIEARPVLTRPAPALPDLRVGRLSAVQLNRLVGDALAAGVGASPDLGPGHRPDTNDIAEFVLRVGAGLHTFLAGGLGYPNLPGLTTAQAQARARLSALVDELLAAGATAQALYRPPAMAAFYWPYPDGIVPNLAGELAWPGPALPGPAITALAQPGQPAPNCVVGDGAAADRIYADAATIDVDTPWRYEGRSFPLLLRPLLPDESSCADLEAG
jgi:hypothetical protein